MPDEAAQRKENLYLKKIRQRIDEIGTHIWTDHVEVGNVAACETLEHLSPAQARRLKYKAVEDGFKWGSPWGTAWFRLHIRVPAAFKGRTVGLLFEPEGEGLIFRKGRPVQGLAWTRDACILFDRARGGEREDIYVESGATTTFGAFAKRTMHAPRLAVLNSEVWRAYWDLACLADMVRTDTVRIGWSGSHIGAALEPDDTRRARILYGLNKAVDLFDYHDTSGTALKASARRVRESLKPLYACKANASAQTIACMGHAHIDVAWLWPLAETVRKCGRTFANVLGLMERYPDFKFCQSQPHLYEFTRDRYPSLYRDIKEKVKEGRWVPTGCTWVEMDCNLTGGESIVRQILFGTRFFKSEFNHDPQCLWIPDVFGYSAALPQILRRSGIRYFLTQKISWSQFTTFPYHSFHWEGIDGSRVLTHFVPADDYNSRLEAVQMISAARAYREKDRSPIQAVPYGWGDGGGGPTCEHLERLQRYRDLEGMPKLTPMSPGDFFKRLEKESANLPSWVGELYLEFHRGTYTTQAWNKKCNRRAELLLRDVEWLSVLSRAHGGRYEQETLNEAWKLVLLNQFHDIIPGSSIGLVYEDSARDYCEVFRLVGGVGDRALRKLLADIDTRGEGTPMAAFNSLSWERRDVVTADVHCTEKSEQYVAVGSDGTVCPVQSGYDGRLRFQAVLPSMGFGVFHLRPGKTDAADVRARRQGMENDRLRVSFDDHGRLVSVYDKTAEREAIPRGAVGNQFILFEDKTPNMDAWDIDVFYNDKPLEKDGRLLSIKVVEQGPVRAVVRIRRAISNSVITQDVVLTAGSSRLDFVTRVEWGDESHVMLKVAFPVAVLSSRARYEIQYGNVQRPTHWNTARDLGRFEVAGQKWADLSEGDYGVALLNDCKYGHDTQGNVMRLTLLRATKSPDDKADINRTHHFTYSLLPHQGDYTNGVVRRAYELNVPVTAVTADPAPGSVAGRISIFQISGDNVIIDAVKKSEDDDGIIVRLYEAHGTRGSRTFKTVLPVRRVMETDLLEREEKRLPARGGALRLNFGPFEIKTLKLVTK